MAKPANPIAKLATKIAALQVKSAKLNEEILALSKLAAEEAKKTDKAPATKPAAKPVTKAPVKKAAAKPAAKKIVPVKK